MSNLRLFCQKIYQKNCQKNFGFGSINWPDLQAKFKLLLRKIAYSDFVQNLICNLVVSYLYFVYFTSRVKFVNFELLINSLHSRSPIIIASWHNRLLLAPFFAKKAKSHFPEAKFMALVSKHGDGRFIGKIAEKMGAKAIYGSTRGNRKSSRGIDFASMRELIENLESGYCLGITPDGPRGPNMKINGHLLEIAKHVSAKILLVSIAASRKFEVNSWDKMQIPLPFGRLCFFVSEHLVFVPIETDHEKIVKLKEETEEELTLAQDNSDRILN